MKNAMICFDGYCPESLLHGQQVEMRLNEDDFWESEATGLQVAVFPPFATILKWRGNRKLRKGEDVASDALAGLLLTSALDEEGKEILPDEQMTLTDKPALEKYIRSIYQTKEDYLRNRSLLKIPELQLQETRLLSMPREPFQQLIALFEQVKESVEDRSLRGSSSFDKVSDQLYNMGLIFSFDWMNWREGWNHIKDANYDFSNISLLEISMYFTGIFRSERFGSGAIELTYKNGALNKLFQVLERRVG